MSYTLERRPGSSNLLRFLGSRVSGCHHPRLCSFLNRPLTLPPSFAHTQALSRRRVAARLDRGNPQFPNHRDPSQTGSAHRTTENTDASNLRRQVGSLSSCRSPEAVLADPLSRLLAAQPVIVAARFPFLSGLRLPLLVPDAFDLPALSRAPEPVLQKALYYSRIS
jgi:hypothetical protein